MRMETQEWQANKKTSKPRHRSDTHCGTLRVLDSRSRRRRISLSRSEPRLDAGASRSPDVSAHERKRQPAQTFFHY